MKKNWLKLLSVLVILGFWVSGCATMGSKKESILKLTAGGAVVYDNEFEFAVPPRGWKLVQVESGGEFGFGFLKTDPGAFPSQSMFVYDEEPFGCSTRFEDREKEFFERYLWASPLSMDIKILERKKVQVVGGEGLAVIAEGKDPVRGEKVKSKLVFGKRGPRVVSWYLTQWRPIDGTYDPSAFETFDKFWGSFKFLKKSFYETL
jgi:hypothetical protein